MNNTCQSRIFGFVCYAVAVFVLMSAGAWAQVTPPTVTTNAATGVGTNSAILNGTVNANNDNSAVTFEYGLTTGYGITRTADPNPVMGNTPTAVSLDLYELVPNTIYHFRAVAQNQAGMTYGADMTFTTTAAAPTAVTQAASNVAPTGATLNGWVNAQNSSTTVTFEYGLTTAYGATVTADQSPVTGVASTAVSAAITGLTSGMTYHFRVVGQNAAGTTYGVDRFFVAGTPPTVTTTAATGVGATSATLNGVVNANGLSADVYFEYGTTTSYNRTAVATPSPVGGSTDTSVSAALTDLLPNTTYHFRVVGENVSGTTLGGDLTFSTGLVPPVVVTTPASGVTTTGATLNGTVNANNSVTTVTFQYGLTTAYGTTVTASQSPVFGAVPTAVSRAIGGLTDSTTYHYRVVGQNAAGTTYGDDMTFFTGASAPSVVTMAATIVDGASATLNGTVNANNSNTVVTFEYGPTTAYGRTATADQSPVSGSSNVAVTFLLPDLIPGTVYHYRVVGQNGVGTTNGNDIAFTTPPLVITDLASGLTSSGATLNGTVNAGNLAATVTFEYGQTAGYGTTVNADQSPLAVGNVLRPVSHAISGLQPNTTYHFRAVGQNTAGTANGVDRSFTTVAIVPTVVTNAASAVGPTGATLNGTVNANFASSTVTFQYGLTTAYGSTVTASPSPVTGGTDTAVSAAILGLQPNATYHFRAVGQNVAGTAFGNDLTFTTLAIPPTVTTNPATTIGAMGATLNGAVNANNLSSTVTFEYGLTTAYGTTVTADQSPVNGFGATVVSHAITGLEPNTTYHFRVVGQNAAGTSNGGDLTFVTLAIAPTVTTDPATTIGVNVATLNGTVTANNQSTTVTFEYGLTTAYGTTVTADQSPVTGFTPTAVSHAIAGLQPNATYHFRVVGQNATGTSNGGDLTFTTLAIAPTVTTDPATAIGAMGATLNGTVNANNQSTTVTFEYGLTTGYGTTVTADQSPVTGFGATAVSHVITGVEPDTTYHFRVVGQNATGTSNGGDLTFTTLAIAPTVTTDPATAVGANAAMLNGTVNANNQSTTVTFEYGLTTAYGTTVTANQSPVSGFGATPVSFWLWGLELSTEYHYRVVGVNATGTSYGEDMAFTTRAGQEIPTLSELGVLILVAAVGFVALIFLRRRSLRSAGPADLD
jgi:phosphodiesterase/alkaline phosphatase D-like protein